MSRKFVHPLPTDPAAVLGHPAPSFRTTDWHRALDAGDSDAAREAFVRELRVGPVRTSPDTDLPALTQRLSGLKMGFTHGMRMEPDLVVVQHYIGVSGIEHTFHGEIDWLLDPTADMGERQDANWRACFNRHWHWVPLADRYQETGDPKYAMAFEKELRSWIGQTSRPDDDGREPPSCWRPIELGIRCGATWPHAFEVFRRSKHISDEALWLMVCSMAEQALQLLLWPTKLNIKAMEINGLIHVGAMFPELARAQSFLSTGVDRACAELEHQVYPDGCQKELAPCYGLLVVKNLFSGLAVAERGGRYNYANTSRAKEQLSLMLQTFAEIADPEGTTPPVHDSPPHGMPPVFREFSKFLPEIDSSNAPWTEDGLRHFAWGGWTVFRTGDRYALFDTGPWGAKHQHADAMQLLLHARGRWLCIDPGKPVYNQSAVTRHLKSSAGHNVVLMDGCRHLPNPHDPMLERPYPTYVGEADGLRVAAARRYARTVPEDGDPSGFWHERVVLELGDPGWLVFDRLTPDDTMAHKWEWLWHTVADHVDPKSDDLAARVEFSGEPFLWIQPLGLASFELEVVNGMTQPDLRGWRSPGDFMEPVATPTVCVKTGPESGPVTLVTLMALPGDTGNKSHLTGMLQEENLTSVVLVNENGRERFSFRGDLELEEVETPRSHFKLAPHTVEPSFSK